MICRKFSISTYTLYTFILNSPKIELFQSFFLVMKPRVKKHLVTYFVGHCIFFHIFYTIYGKKPCFANIFIIGDIPFVKC